MRHSARCDTQKTPPDHGRRALWQMIALCVYAEKAADFLRPCGIHRISFFYAAALKMDDVRTAFADQLRVVRNDIHGLSTCTQRFQKSSYLQHMPVVKSTCWLVQKDHGTLSCDASAHPTARQDDGQKVLQGQAFQELRLLHFRSPPPC